MSKYLIKENKIVKSVPKDFDITDKIPAGNYIIKFDQKEEVYYLERTKDFKAPKKVYGKEIPKEVEKYLNSYDKFDKNLGILFRGLKGTGKTLCSELICIEAAKKGIPTLQVTQSFTGAEFLTYINSISQPIILYFDEFDKVYDFDYDKNKNVQEDLLSILDGSIKGTKRLSIFTANDGDIHDALLNRTGRIRYLKDYKGLGDDVIDEVIKDKLEAIEAEKELKRILKVVGNVSMDILISFIEEINEYYPSYSVVEIANSLNVSPSGSSYTCEWETTSGTSLSSEKKYSKAVVSEHPLSVEVIHLYPSEQGTKRGSLRDIMGGGDDCIKIPLKDSKILEVSDTIVIEYKEVLYKFSPFSEYKFHFE